MTQDTYQLIFSHPPILINDLLHSLGNGGDQLLEEVALLGLLQPHHLEGIPPLLHVGAFVVLQVLLHPGPDCLNGVQVRQATSPT
jgi:hypothetical protein